MRDRSRKLGKALRTAAALMLVLLAAPAYSASKPVLVLGDSLSAGYGLARGTGWVSLLQNRLEKTGIDAPVVNASISGETTSGGRSRLPALLEQQHPSVVVIELGANDGLRGLPLGAAEANLRSMIEISKKRKAKVLLIGMRLPPNYGRAYTTAFSALFPKLAREENVPLVPFLLEGVATQEQLFQSDRLHPTAAAQSVILDNVWPKLKALLTR